MGDVCSPPYSAPMSRSVHIGRTWLSGRAPLVSMSAAWPCSFHGLHKYDLLGKGWIELAKLAAVDCQ
jgi:hypothetical protein